MAPRINHVKHSCKNWKPAEPHKRLLGMLTFGSLNEEEEEEDDDDDEEEGKGDDDDDEEDVEEEGGRRRRRRTRRRRGVCTCWRGGRPSLPSSVAVT